MTRRALFIACALVACHGPAPTTTCPEPASEPEPAPEPAVVAEPESEPAVVAETEPADEAAEIEVVVGECDLRGVPDGYREPVTEEETAELAGRLRGWLETGHGGFAFPPRRGIAFAKSDDDEGADPPYPSWSGAQGVHACGLEARWLASSLRGTFAARGGEYRNGPITCQGNVCCYLALGEYDSAGGVVFTRQDERWELRAVYQVADNGTLGEAYVAEGYRAVRRHLSRLARAECAGEPEARGGR